MNAHQCQRVHLKPFEDGQACMICGAFHWLPIVPMPLPAKSVRETARVGIDFHNESLIRIRAAKYDAWMLTVADQITALLQAKKCWAEISRIMGDRQHCKDVKVLRKYYHRYKGAA